MKTFLLDSFNSLDLSNKSEECFNLANSFIYLSVVLSLADGRGYYYYFRRCAEWRRYLMFLPPRMGGFKTVNRAIIGYFWRWWWYQARCGDCCSCEAIAFVGELLGASLSRACR